MDDTLFFEQWLHSNAIDEPSSITFADAVNEEDAICPLQSYLSAAVTSSSRPLKQQKNSSWDSSNSLDSNLKYSNKQVGIAEPKEELSWSSSSPEFINFDSSLSFDNMKHPLKPFRGTERVNIGSITVCDAKPKPFSQVQEHILDERKRRERINERLISLSKLIPGLSKMDKATVLADAVKYIKQLQEKVKSLEQKTDVNKAMQSQVFVKRYEVCSSDQKNIIHTSSDETSSDDSVTTRDLIPEIETRVCDRDVLITIHCKKKKGVLEKIVAEIEKLHLTVVNSSLTSFGDSALNTVVVAQMDEEFTMNMNQLLNNLHGVLEIL